ncbi:MAG: hypothetical protein GY796_20525, partial [Chloroflexi bacterium]|nr:hypothetical protein [Chloroflexota bacterium]
ADIAQLHQQAALWYQAHGQPLAAVDHALAAADYPLAAELMVAVSREVLMFGEGSALRQWVESLPAELQTSRRRLSLFYAWSLIRTGALTQATAVLEAVADQLDTPLLWGEWSALRARVAVMTGDTDVSIRFSQKALHKLPPDQHMLRSEVSINLGFSHLQQADLEAAREAFAEAAQNSSHDPGLWAVMFATFYWGQTYERQAQLPAAFDIYQRGLEIAQTQTNGRTPSPAVGFMHVGLGGLFYEWNRLAEAETHLRHALTFAKRCGDHKMLIYARGQLAQYLAAVSDWQAAFALIDDLEQQIQAASPTIRRATLALQQGDTLPVQQWASQLGIALTDSPEKFQEWPTAYLELVRLHLAQREFQGTLPALQMLADVADTRHNTHFLIEVTLTQALALAKQGDMVTAVPLFQRTLTLAEPGGYVRLFLDQQEASLARLLHHVAGNGVTTEYARSLLVHLDPTAVIEETIIQPLSGRELETLQYLAEGLTNREISQRMVVSINTVKAHTRRLYQKLNVNNRTQAVGRARDLQLL